MRVTPSAQRVDNGGAAAAASGRGGSVSAMTVVHPITRAWITTGGTGAQNYDEFADDAEITAIIEANPRSALAVEMPHRAPESVGRSFLDCLPDAAARLARVQAEGGYRPAERVVVLYRITDPSGGVHRVRDVSRWSTPTRSRPARTSRAWSSATRTSSSRRCASGSPSPRR